MVKKSILCITLFSLLTATPAAQPVSRKALMITGAIMAAVGGCGALFAHSKEHHTQKMLAILERGVEQLYELKEEAEERELTEKEIKQKDKIITTLKKILACKKLSRRSINEGTKALQEKKELYKKLKFGSGVTGIAGALLTLFGYFKDDTPPPSPSFVSSASNLPDEATLQSLVRNLGEELGHELGLELSSIY